MVAWGSTVPLVAAVAAATPQASFSQLSFSNGFGAAVYDVARARLVTFRDHLYARLDERTPARELLYDLYFGLREGGRNVWLGEAPVEQAGYEGDTGIVRVLQRHGALEATQWFFAPFGVEAPVVVAILAVRNTGPAPVTDGAVFSLQNLHVGEGDGTQGESITWTDGAYEERGGGRLALHVPVGAPTRRAASPENPYLAVKGGGRLVDVDASGTRDDAVCGFEWDLAGLAPGETRAFGVVVAYEESGSRAALDGRLAPLLGPTALEMLEAARTDWAAFQARAKEPSGLGVEERAVYRRSLAILRMAQVREPNQGDRRPFGQIVASLPPGKWNIAWVRDMVYAIEALLRAGLVPEARAGLAFLWGGQAGAYEAYVGAPYALSVVRYFGNGTEESDWNQDGPNVELDGFGLALAALEAYEAETGDRSLVDAHAEAVFARTADVLVGGRDTETGLVRADSSIWETHWDNGGRKRYAYTSAAAVRGLRAAAALAERRGDAARAATYREAAEGIAAAIATVLVHPPTGILKGSVEERDRFLDAAVVEAFNWNVLDPAGDTARRTLDAFRRELWLGLTGHGYRRNDDGGEYDEREWIWVDLRIAQAARRAGRSEHAEDLLGWVTAQARANFDLLPENLHPFTADFAGEVPMVGYGAGAYVAALWEREGATGGDGGPDGGMPEGPDGGTDAGAGGGPDRATGGDGGCAVAPATRAQAAEVAPGPGGWMLLGGVVLAARRRLARRPERRRSVGRRRSATGSGWKLGPLRRIPGRMLGRLAPTLLAGCGMEALFFGGGFEPTPKPVAEVTFTSTAAVVEAWDVEGELVAVADGASGRLELGERDFANVRLVARDATGRVAARAMVPEVRVGTIVEAGALDAAATATALLIEARVDYDGLSLGATPSAVVAQMKAKAAADEPELLAFRALVTDLPPGALAPLGPALDETFAEEAPEVAEAYQKALEAAIAKIAVPIVCDPALVRVMFTVDVSGQALDGNGTRQLIRQPPKEGRVYLGFTVDDSSPVSDAAGLLPPKLLPNDPNYVMYDDGTNGDEAAGDGVFTRLVTLPRGMRIIYKYTDGSAGEGFTRTEEWPGNARILQVEDVVTRHLDGRDDCLVIRRDSFGDEASNKNFTSLAAGLREAGGALGWDVDLGGIEALPLGDGRVAGGLDLGDVREHPPLTPAGIPEARENGICTKCPAPLVLALDDDVPPRLLKAAFLSTTEIEVRFSEAMDFAAAQDLSAYLVVDTALRPLPIRGAAALGDRVRLRVEGPDLAETYTLHVRPIPDASAARNLLEGPTAVSVGPDVTPPRPSTVAAASLKDLYPSARLADPTVGELIVLSFTEELDRASAEDVAHYRVETVFGEPLPVRAAFLRDDGRRVMLVTAPQRKRMKYTVDVVGVKDFAGNVSPPIEPLPFDGFALYRFTVGVVVGHAWVTRDGKVRGIPRGERLYLTGTPLGVARALDGTNLSVPGRTDVTGVPEFELHPTDEQHAGQPIYRLTILVPPGVYAWKAAHGIPGEWVDPPPTLEKVTKSLGTTNDARGVNVDPVTLIGRNGRSYAGAVISLDGTDKPGDKVLFKRENPDEICVVKDADVECPTIVVGTWRDLDDFIAGGVLRDYDDGEPEVPPTRLVPDLAPPAPIHVEVRDSESLRISFDEAIAAGAAVTASVRDAAGRVLEISELRVGFPEPNDLVLVTAAQAVSTAYTVELGGLSDELGNAWPRPLRLSWTSPSRFEPFSPFEDHAPPVLLSAVPESPTTLRVKFDEKVAPSAADPARYAIVARAGGPAPSVLAAVLASGGKDVLLTTTTQPLMAELRLMVSNIQDLASPPNTLSSAQVDFLGFGDLAPPVLVHARAIGPQAIALVFDEPLEGSSAASPSSYAVAGVTVTGVEFSADPVRLASAFDPQDAPYVRNVVLVKTTPMTASATYAVTANVRDLSGNAGGGTVTVTGVATPPTVDVVIEYEIGNSQTVAGEVPPRAISPSRFFAEREGLFLVGIGGFPAEGTPLLGPEPQLRDDGMAGDRVAGDGVYSIRIAQVPLGSQLEWKAFAPYTVAWKQAHPEDSAAAFADATPGPSAFSDGQEFPGNENGARILADVDGDGVVRLRNLFGDETTYKKLAKTPAFIWITGDFAYAP